MSFNIIGTGSAFPERVVTNDDMSRMVDTSDEWIQTRTGIKSRRVLTSETLSDLAALAANRALENAGICADDIDLIICSTIQGDYITPSMACVVRNALDIRCPAFDVNAACSGFIYSLDIAAGFFARGTVNKVLIVSADAMSRHFDWHDRATCVLFGDAAGAAVLEKGDGLLSIKLTSFGLTDLLVIEGSRGNSPYINPDSEEYPFLRMNGTEVYKSAVSAICEDLSDVIRQAGLEMTDIDHVLPHQANIRIINAAITKLGIPKQRWHQNIAYSGNTSSATIPTLLDEINRAGLISSGQKLAFSAFGSGFATAACVIKWR